MDPAAPGRPAGHREFTFGFNKKWELSQGLGLVESSQHKIFFFLKGGGGWGETFVNAGSNRDSLGLIVGRRREEREAETGGEGKR